MALKYNGDVDVTSIGARYRSVSTVALDNNYVIGGYLIDPAKIGLTRIEQVETQIIDNNFLFSFNRASGKLKGFTTSGGGGGLTFTGTLMSPHPHLLSHTSETLTPLGMGYTMLVDTATFPFVPGDVITGAVSGATATVNAPTSFATTDLSFNPPLGNFIIGETISASISGSTAKVTSAMFRIYTPTFNPVLLEGATNTSNFGLSFFASSNDINPDMQVTYSTLVGNFTEADTLTGGSSGGTARVVATTTGGMTAVQMKYPFFQLGETITGAPSTATAVVTGVYNKQTVVHRSTSTTNPNGDFILFYPNTEYVGALRFNYINVGSVAANTAGTPAGTITGGGGGGGLIEISGGTDLSAITNLQIVGIGE